MKHSLYILLTMCVPAFAIQPLADDELANQIGRDGLQVETANKLQAEEVSYINTVSGGKIVFSEITLGSIDDQCEFAGSGASTTSSCGLNLEAVHTNADLDTIQSTLTVGSATLSGYVVDVDTDLDNQAFFVDITGGSEATALDLDDPVYDEYSQALYYKDIDGDREVDANEFTPENLTGSQPATVSMITANETEPVGDITRLSEIYGDREFNYDLTEEHDDGADDFSDNVATALSTTQISITADNKVQVETQQSTRPTDLHIKEIQLGDDEGTLVSGGGLYVSNIQQPQTMIFSTLSEQDGFDIEGASKMHIDAIHYFNGSATNGQIKVNGFTQGNIAIAGLVSEGCDPTSGNCALNLTTEDRDRDYSITMNATDGNSGGDNSDFTNRVDNISTAMTLFINDEGELAATQAAVVGQDLFIEGIQVGQKGTSMGALLLANMQTQAQTVLISTDISAVSNTDGVLVQTTSAYKIGELHYINPDSGGSSVILTDIVVAEFIGAKNLTGCSADSCAALNFSGDAAAATPYLVTDTEFVNGTMVATTNSTDTAYYIDANNHLIMQSANTPSYDISVGSVRIGDPTLSAGSMFINNMEVTNASVEVGTY